MDRAAAGSQALRDATAGVSVRIQQVVRDGTDERCYVVRVDDGGVTVRAGRDADAEIVVTEDVATAAAVARGDLSPQEAFMTGRIRVAGDVPALLACYEALGRAGDAFAEVRAATTY
jgi:putative sterol carrier protein